MARGTKPPSFPIEEGIALLYDANLKDSPNQRVPAFGAASQKGLSGTGLKSVPATLIKVILVDYFPNPIAFSGLPSDENRN